MKLEDGKLQLEEGSEWKYSFKENNVFVLEKKQRDSPLKGYNGETLYMYYLCFPKQ